jgi:rhodanese-related sulfurtransferase
MLARFSLNQKLAGLALALGVVAIFSSPMEGGRVSIDPAELAVMVERDVDHVTVYDLAEWIVQKRADFRLIDLRGEQAYAEYHVPGAEPIPVARLVEADLARNEKIVLYAADDTHAAQAWFLLRARGYRGAYILDGGLTAWRDEILFPTLTENPTPFQQERDAKRSALSTFFGGTPRGPGNAPASAAVAMPKVTPPTLTVASGAGAAPKRKKKEGC